ncbi:MAG: bifunctional [glutamine synthetase] adenylyltransferase/[glutamine synthetase]-adenylyl-L-tyrosine phosphorylase [Rhodospirillales bacterium]|nr:bifunctional [glutamine synthetase] adenylyltransferase/[glutamine synthetase]-adenylyl-L-tyrosine phosphorylase [Rhodospirillales bacterium]
MRPYSLVINPESLPWAADSDRAETGIERWSEAAKNLAQSTGDAGLTEFTHHITSDPDGRRLLEAVFGNSPFLAQCAVSDPSALRDIFEHGAEAAAADVTQRLDRMCRRRQDQTELVRSLRTARTRTAMVIAVADITGAWHLERITGALTDFADAALRCAVAHVRRNGADADAFRLSSEDEPETDSGYVVLAMGKLGARELNYSSDIDLIVLYDPKIIRTDDLGGLHRHLVRMTRDLVRVLEGRTADGYVFRTDLRLRPDPGATPPALSIIAAESYYGSMGQNWERAAMIKARPAAGDLAAGASFLERLAPFIWRKNLDFAAIQDIHSIKRQIIAYRGSGKIAVAGHNIKLGRGGIREIEFFAQTQQLIWGGREPGLRCASTVDALCALAAAGRLAPDVADDMVAAYRFLRRVEHRLQMIADEQTHSLPESERQLSQIALFLGFPDRSAFAVELEAVLSRVAGHYASLFEDTPSLGTERAGAGNLVFTGGDPDPNTLRTIETLGFRNADAVDRAVRGWHHGRYRATRSQRAREILTELMPNLLSALARTPNADDAFARFDRFLAQLPAGVQLFSMFHSKPELLDLVAEIIGGAPRLADHLSRHPSVLDSVLAGDFFDLPPPLEILEDELERMLGRVDEIEDALDVVRRWAHDRGLQIGVQSLKGLLGAEATGEAWSNIAESILGRLVPRIEDHFRRRHGHIPDAAMAVVAMGKFGGRELTPASDLDLVFIYDAPEDTVVSDGDRPLAPTHYFARLSQRLISAITVQTAEGSLFEVDMRLRPSGFAGPIASSVQTFKRYYTDSAWTWERMALTRGRVVAGPEDLRRRVEATMRKLLTQKMEPQRLLADVAEMRQRIQAEHGTDDPWNVKHLPGGLVDVEFIAQYLQLRFAHASPDILSPNTRCAFARLRDAGHLDASAAADLVSALELWQTVQGLLRLSLGRSPGRGHEGEAPDPLLDALARATGVSNLAALEETMRITAASVVKHYDKIVGKPSAAARKRALEATRDGKAKT